MTALNTTTGFALFLLLASAAVCVVIGAGFFLVKRFGRAGPLVHCPHCNCQGTFHWWGNYRCRVCEHHFTLNAAGQVVPSVLKPVLVKVSLWLLIPLAVCFLISQSLAPFEAKYWWWLFFLGAFESLVKPLTRKPFPHDWKF